MKKPVLLAKIKGVKVYQTTSKGGKPYFVMLTGTGKRVARGGTLYDTLQVAKAI